MKRKYLVLMVFLLVVAVGLASCRDDEQEPVEVTRIVEVEVPGECPDVEEAVCPEVETPACPECPEPEAIEAEPAVAEVPFEALWLNSPHNDTTAEAFVHWDTEDPAEVPTSCAKCHSTHGYLDFLGADGSEAGVVDAAAPVGTTVECVACHNEVTVVKDSVVFPSGIEITGLGDESRCMECHQGRHSTVSVNQSIADAGLEGNENLDTVSEDLGFSNIHYYAAAATQYGTLAKGGYEYEGKSYDTRFDHVEGYNTCDSCHDPHSLEIQVEECVVCHVDVDSLEDFQDIRMPGSLVDYDGDGNLTEGIASEINDLRAILYEQMGVYTTLIAEVPIGYGSNHPYFFFDTNGDGEIDEEEGVRDNAFNAWTPRLAKAAYNYQVSLKDPGRFAHGGKYIIQLLYDSIEDLNSAISEPVDMTAMTRIDHGHFAGSEEAFRHWDEEGMVPASCSRCHSAAGLSLFIEEGVAISQHPSNGLACETCHTDVATGAIRIAESVPFPNGADLALDDPGSNLCLNCHQGRESGASVDRITGDLPDDQVAEGLRFLNIHYFAAGASLFGTEANGMYEYEGQEYNGLNRHVPAFNTCTECHYTHQLEVEVEECADCHFNVETLDDLHNIRLGSDPVDYDGDGDAAEGIGDEVATLQEMLYAAIQDYAANVLGAPILYDSSAYPYYFNDLDGDGESSPNEVNFDNQFRSWSPRLLRAAYNYQYVAKDPGAFAHNGDYIMQVLYDTLADLGMDVSGLTRPPVVVIVPDSEG